MIGQAEIKIYPEAMAWCKANAWKFRIIKYAEHYFLLQSYCPDGSSTTDVGYAMMEYFLREWAAKNDILIDPDIRDLSDEMRARAQARFEARMNELGLTLVEE